MPTKSSPILYVYPHNGEEETMCKRHTICDGEADCIYLVNGRDMSAEGLAEWSANLSVPFQLSNVGDMMLAVCEAAPTIPIKDAAQIASYLDSVGYCKAPF